MSLRLAMWSGPRNISTAMMRAWGNRPDCYVTDEPLYAHYLQVTHAQHPGAEEVIANGETDWHKVAAWLMGPVPEGKRIWFQKHMAHHIVPPIELAWLDSLTNCFLIREPKEMLTSLLAVTPAARLADTGLPQQLNLFHWVRKQTARIPPVIDSRDVLQDPRKILTKLCGAVGVEFMESMLHWPPGPRATDGIWAKHWYGNVEKTTGFEPYKPKNQPVPEDRRELLRECEELYEQLHQHAIR